jgi:hypothetical protein
MTYCFVRDLMTYHQELFGKFFEILEESDWGKEMVDSYLSILKLYSSEGLCDELLLADLHVNLE